MNAGRAVERIDHEAGIVGKSRQAGRLCRGFRLDAGVVAKRHAGFVRLFKPQLTRGYGVDPVGRKQFPHFGELAGIVRRDHQATRDAAM